MAHVAEASEASGRVLFFLERGMPLEPLAVDGATRMASAYRARLETLAVDESDNGRWRDLSVARHVEQRDDAMQCDLRGLDVLLASQRTEVAGNARARDVTCYHSRSEGNAIDRLTEACLIEGPWNVVALSGRVRAGTAEHIATILANVGGATGVVVAPAGKCAATGPVVVVADDVERLPMMMRAAQTLSDRAGIDVLLAADSGADVPFMETHAELFLQGASPVRVHRTSPSHDVDGALDAMLCGLKPGFVIARFGGAALPGARAFSRTIALAGAPFLLVR